LHLNSFNDSEFLLFLRNIILVFAGTKRRRPSEIELLRRTVCFLSPTYIAERKILERVEGQAFVQRNSTALPAMVRVVAAHARRGGSGDSAASPADRKRPSPSASSSFYIGDESLLAHR
jgi:hypothetical protein